jgi:hypothetical protein
LITLEMLAAGVAAVLECRMADSDPDEMARSVSQAMRRLAVC